MAGEVVHRGPDDSGHWVDEECGVALGFRRLSILELTGRGHQPMVSPSGRYILVFNGEIYNYRELLKQLAVEAPTLLDTDTSRSDTAVILAAFEHWGIASAVKQFAGMFAFAVWDRSKRELTLGRDRIGEKPLYYGWLGDKDFGFASELKSLKVHPKFGGQLSKMALSAYFRKAYVPTPLSIYESIFKLQAGTLLRITSKDIASRSLPEPSTYWSLHEAALDGIQLRENRSVDEKHQVDEFESLLKGIVQREMVADVPLGAFLSGGIDSSLIVSLMQSLSDRPVQTFSIGFESEQFNEAPYAAAVARHLGTNHTEQYVSDRDARDVVPLLSSIYDEPFADSSQIPTFLVSKIARSKVTVVLTGDGGDEMFGGYPGYWKLNALWEKLDRLPPVARNVLPPLLDIAAKIPGQQSFFDKLSHIPGMSRAIPDPTHLYRLGPHLGYGTPLLMAFDEMTSSSLMPLSTQYQAVLPWNQFREVAPELLTRLANIEAMMFWSTLGALPDDMLVKVDRASMAASLETRAPFLDHGIVEYSWRLPLEMKVRGESGKWILRQVLDKYVPRELIERPKKGFGIPLREWLTGPLREWANDILSPSNIKSYGVLDPDVVSSMWSGYQKDGLTSNAEIWSLIILQSWLEP